MSKVISNELKVIGPEQAQEYLDNYPYARQRGLKAKNIAKLAKAMRKGSFKQGTQVHIAVLGDKMFLVNGQHTLTAIAETKCPQQLSLLITECDSEDEINHIYAVEDRGAARSTQDVLKAHDIAAEFNLAISAMRTALSSVRFIEGGFFGAVQNRMSLDDLETLSILRQHKAAIQKFNKYIAGASGPLRVGLQRSSTQSVFLVLLSSEEKHKEAADLLIAIANDEYDEAEPVVKLLQEHMAGSYMPTGRAVHRGEGMHPSYAARYVAAGWNAFVENREFRRPEEHERAEPINILYTQYVNDKASY